MCVFRDDFVFLPYSFLINDILPYLDSDYFFFNVKKKINFLFNLNIQDMNIFSEKKTNLGCLI